MYNADSLKRGISLSVLSAYDYYVDAMSNYMERRYAACVCLMTTAREEIGKGRILNIKMKEMGPSDKISKKDIYQLIKDHDKKIKHSLGIISVPIPKGILEKHGKAIVENDSAALKLASDEMEKLSQARRASLPSEIHKKRMAAQYVDAIGGGAWSGRGTITLEDCYGELINLGSEILTDIEWLINDKEYEGELALRGIDHNTVNSLAVQHMMEIYKHKKDEG